MDSIHRYAAPIQHVLADIVNDDALMSTMRDRAVAIKRYDSEDQAQTEIVSAIDYVLDAYASVGGIISEIDRKHSTYTKSSIEKIQYLMTADQTIKGKLVDVLQAYGEGSITERAAIGDLLEAHIQVNRQEFIDGKSLYHKSLRARRLDVPSLEVDERDSEDFSTQAMMGMMEQLKKGYPIARVREYVDGLFAHGEMSVHSSELVLGGDGDFILLMLAVVRETDKGMKYWIEKEEGSVLNGGYRIPNMTIWKGAKKHVE